MNDVEIVPIGNSLFLEEPFSNTIEVRTYNVFTTRSFLSHSQVYEEDGELKDDIDI